MKTYALIALLGLAAAGAALPLIAGKQSSPTPTVRAEKERIERGKYLVSFGGCNDCHTPLKFGPHGPEPDMARYLSGHPETAKLPPPPKNENSPWFATTAGLTAWSGPWGISYAPNLTPDENTGLGIWTEEMFAGAMRTGKHMGSGRDILPPMPWRAVASLSDDDLKAVFAYLRSIPAIKNRVPEPVSPGAKFAHE
jgi:hypothetical protein